MSIYAIEGGVALQNRRRKKFSIYLFDNELELIQNAALHDGFKVGEYFRYLALNNLPEITSTKSSTNSDDIKSENTKTHTIKLELTNSDYQLLKRISAEVGLSMSNYLRNCIRLKKLKLYNINIKHQDLDEHTLVISELTKKIVGICKTIKSSKNAYPQDIAKIIEYINEINNDNKILLDKIYKERKKLYLNAKKELLKNIREV